MTASAPQINPGEIINWPMLKIDYQTRAEKIAPLLPAGIEPAATAGVHLTVYNFPVQEEPEFGLVVNVDADYNGEQGLFSLAYGIDQEAAVYISQEMNGQPKYLCDVDYYRMLDKVHAKVTHHGFTFFEFNGQVAGTVENPDNHTETEWWIKVSRGSGLMPTKTYDLPPHVVRVHSTYGTAFQQQVEGTLTLRESPWDPIKELLPIESEVSARLWTPIFLGREVGLAGKLDGDAFWDHADVIGGSRWPGQGGGPRK